MTEPTLQQKVLTAKNRIIGAKEEMDRRDHAMYYAMGKYIWDSRTVEEKDSNKCYLMDRIDALGDAKKALSARYKELYDLENSVETVSGGETASEDFAGEA